MRSVRYKTFDIVSIVWDGYVQKEELCTAVKRGKINFSHARARKGYFFAANKVDDACIALNMKYISPTVFKQSTIILPKRALGKTLLVK